MATLSDFDQADYFAEIILWFDRVDEQIDLETKRLATVRRAHTSLFRRTKYSKGGDYEIDELERMVTTTNESTNDGSTSGEFNRKRNMSNRWLKTNTPGSGK